MSFPGTYNINYYKGDTLEFVLSPKDTAGLPFVLQDFINESSPAFTVAERRGETDPSKQINCFASINTDFASILCVIRPEDGEKLVAGKQYVYDIEISKLSSPYNVVYTLLTGNISVTEQVTLPTSGDESIPVPGDES
jgi:hypothetical protein